VEHFTECLAGLVSKVQSLTELGAAGSVHCTDVLDVGVDAGTKRGTLWQGRDTARGRDLHDT